MIHLILCGVLSFVTFAQIAKADTKTGEVHQIVMKSISFEPKTITIKSGESVEWVNQSYTEHSATADDAKSFDTGLVQPQKKSKQIQLTGVGTYQYHCSVHGKTMHGTIIVQ